MAYKGVDLSKILFLDIECVSGEKSWDKLNESLKELWTTKASYALRKPIEELTNEEISDNYNDRAGIFAEFGKIVVISVGVIVRKEDGSLGLKLRSYYGDDEAQLLKEFAAVLDFMEKRNGGTVWFCGHNIKEFDIPYICRRLLVNFIELPRSLQISGKKPWELNNFLDTMEMWKFGDRKNFTSLKLLAATLGFESPKNDIDGSEVGRVYWQEADIERIGKYCEKDVRATVQLFLRYHLEKLIDPINISSSTEWPLKK